MFDVGIRSYLLCINFSAHYFPKCVYHLWKISGEFFRCIVCIFVSSNKNTSNFFLYDLYLVYLNFLCYFSRLKPIHWKGVERVDIFFLLLVLVSMFWVFSQLGMLVEVLLYIACIMLRYIPFTCRFSNAFTIKKPGFCQKPFLHQHEYSCHFCPSVCLCGGLQSIIYFIIPVSFWLLLYHSGWHFGSVQVFNRESLCLSSLDWSIIFFWLDLIIIRQLYVHVLQIFDIGT